MTSLRVTPPTKEKGAEVEGMVGVGGSIVSVRDRFGRSWAFLYQTEAALMSLS